MVIRPAAALRRGAHAAGPRPARTPTGTSGWSTALRRIQAGSLDTLGAAVVPRETPDGFDDPRDGRRRSRSAAGACTSTACWSRTTASRRSSWDPRLAELRGHGRRRPTTNSRICPEPPPLPAGAGPHLVYLKAWQRERTAIEDPRLIEPALGVDTTTRLQTAWQVKVLPDVGEAVTCATPLEDVPGFTAAEPRAAGRLTTGTADVAVEPDPCRVPPSGGYKGLENQLYRVEIHDAGDLAGADRATFKWSRDNAHRRDAGDRDPGARPARGRERRPRRRARLLGRRLDRGHRRLARAGRPARRACAGSRRAAASTRRR